MIEDSTLVARYVPLFAAEYERIGLTENDLRYLASDGELSEHGLAAALERLRGVPSGIGAQAYFARYGVDFEALKHGIGERRPQSGAG